MILRGHLVLVEPITVQSNTTSLVYFEEFFSSHSLFNLIKTNLLYFLLIHLYLSYWDL